MTKLLIFIFIVIFSLTSCSPKINHQNELEIAIANNFTAPTNHFDTLLLEPSRAEFPCPPTKEIKDKVFNSRIDSSIYLSIFTNRINKPILIWTKEKSNSVNNEIAKVTSDFETEKKLRLQFFTKRLLMTLDGQINNNNSVDITATFQNNDTMWTIIKQFNFSNNKWTCKDINYSWLAFSDNFHSLPEVGL